VLWATSVFTGDQRMMSFGFSGSPPPFLANKYDVIKGKKQKSGK